MKNADRWFKLLIGLIILFAALFVVSLGLKGPPDRDEFLRMPKFRVNDDFNQPIRSETLKDKYVLVHFLATNNDIEILRRLFYDWESELVVFIAVCNEAIPRSPNALSERSNFHVISVDKKPILSAFSYPNAGTFYLYDLSGRLARNGGPNDNSEIVVKQTFNRLINGKYFRLSELLGPGEDILSLYWLSQVSDLMKSETRDYYLVAMFRNICQGCGSGSIIRALNEVYREKEERVDIICLVNNSFNDSDIRSLRSQLGINYHVAMANESLSAKWEALVREYSAPELTDIVILVNSRGRVLKTMDPSCSDCARALFSYLNEL
jgi:hypothetical protein